MKTITKKKIDIELLYGMDINCSLKRQEKIDRFFN